MDASETPIQTLAIGIDAAAKMISVSERTIYRMIKRGEIETVHVGQRHLVRRDSLLRRVGVAADAA